MTKLYELRPEDVQRNLAIYKQLIREAHPDIEVERGPFHDIVLYYASAFATANQQHVQDAMKAISLVRLMKEPDAASNDMVDRVMGNWLMRRKKGAIAAGTITIVLDTAIPLVIPNGFIFKTEHVSFKTQDTYVTRLASGGVKLLSSDRLLVKTGKDQWSFTIPVIAMTPGSNGNVRRGTKLRTNKELTRHLKRVVVNDDFTNGADEETNTQMLGRLTRSVSGKVMSNRLTTEALLCEHPKFDRATNISIVGFGDPEMLRDRQTLWPGSVGGHVDLYIKPASGTLTKDVELTGELTSPGHWQISIPANVLPGFYDVLSIKHRDGTECFSEQETRGLDKTTVQIKVDIRRAFDAVYSAYQTATLHVVDNADTTDANFIVTIKYIDGISEAQSYVSNRSRSSPAGDTLVRAAVPCFTNIEVEIWRRNTDPECSIQNIKEAVAEYVNSTGFVGRLAASDIVGVVAKYLEGSMVIKGIKMSGNIRRADGWRLHIVADSILVIPQEPEHLVSSRTTAFFQEAEDVEVKVIIVDGPEI